MKPVSARPLQQLGRMLAISLAISAAYPAAAQSVQPSQPLPAVASAPNGQALIKDLHLSPSSSSKQNLAQILVQTDQNGLPADGQSAVLVTVQLQDAAGQPLRGAQFITVENSAGRILLDGARSDSLGPENGDWDRVTPGLQVKVENGQAQFRLLAPSSPQEVLLRISSGQQSAQGIISFVPELRQMLAVGLIEGVISRRTISANDLSPARFNDGFEQEITRWSRQFNQGKANLAARTAFFLKGKISGEKLLTAAYDSDLPTRNRLQKDINPQEFYPVYGDSAITAFDARSSQRLYVRIDDKKSYLLYGDFSTGAGFASSVPGPNSGLQARKLGQYQRTVTGLSGHWQNDSVQLNGFAIHDNVRQVIEEYQANGTSGPFAVGKSGALSNSEKVEIIVRDKNQSDRIKQVTPLLRFDDYSFEPFSGRILFKQAVPALTAEGDPQSVRITYEVEQGGEQFWVMGVDGQWQLLQNLNVGASSVHERNPQAPYRLHSVYATAQFGPHTSLVVELAQSSSQRDQINGLSANAANPAGQSALDELQGQAARLALAHKSERNQASLEWQKADAYFNNPASGISPGHSDINLKLAHQIQPDLKLYGQALRSKDSQVVGQRDGARVGAQYSLTPNLQLDLSFQHMREEGEVRGSNIAPNNGTGGGFFGSSNSAINPLNGTSSLPASTDNSTGEANQPINLHANTVALGLRYQASEKLAVSGQIEHSVAGQSAHRYELASQYQLSERSRLYARYENQTGLASRYSLNPAEKSNAFSAGVETTYLPGASLFTEYRLRDALASETANTRDLQLASGLRNSWNLAEGVVASTNLEYLHIFAGNAQKGVALATSLDYNPQPLWKAAIKLELRRLYDKPNEIGNQGQDQYLNTISLARKLDRDFTLLARNYLLLTRNHDNSSGQPIGNSLQERAQIGLAWRPVDNNRVNGLARYEYKNVRDDAQSEGESYFAHILSAHLDYHPSRPWWMTGRVAAKRSTERRLPAGQQNYSAQLLAGRLVYDITENWDIGILAAWLRSPQGGSQYARGIEAGYLLKENLWLSVGYNQSGFSERDLSSADYTAKGVYLRLRFKFDETLFKGDDASVNRSLPRH